MSVAALLGIAAPASATQPQWVGLGGGRIGTYEWSVRTGSGGARASSGTVPQPCLLVGTAWQSDPLDLHRSRYRACASADGGLDPIEPPVIAIGVQPSTGAPVGMTAVGMIVAPRVRQVRAVLRDGSTVSIPLHSLSSLQARAARVGQLRYAAFAVRGWWCAERLTTLDATGRTLWESPEDGYECSADGSAGGPVSFE